MFRGRMASCPRSASWEEQGGFAVLSPIFKRTRRNIAWLAGRVVGMPFPGRRLGVRRGEGVQASAGQDCDESSVQIPSSRGRGFLGHLGPLLSKSAQPFAHFSLCGIGKGSVAVNSRRPAPDPVPYPLSAGPFNLTHVHARAHAHRHILRDLVPGLLLSCSFRNKRARVEFCW